MGTIKFEVPHGLPHADAKARVEALLGYWSRKYGVKSNWAGDTATLAGKVMGFSFDTTLTVGASNFNIDPTHRNPVFPETAKFMLEITGFERVDIEYLALPDRQPFSETADGALLNKLLFGPQDFAVIGRKSESP